MACYSTYSWKASVPWWFMCISSQPTRYMNHPLLLPVPPLPADLDVQRFEQAGRRSVRHRESNLWLRDKRDFSSHGRVRVEIPSYPKNADPFRSATVHLPLWDTHTQMTHCLTMCVLICMRIILAAATSHIKAEDLWRERNWPVCVTQPTDYWRKTDPVFIFTVSDKFSVHSRTSSLDEKVTVKQCK